MSASKCARCDKTVYPVEGLRCLDKIWHKGCFKCAECNMTLNMKNYKGFEKRPYCNAHCPQAKATTVADTPEIRRLAENTRIQSQAKYHEDFEKSKGKNFTTIADDPEIRRVKETSKIISNASYHGDMEKKKHMEEKRNTSGQEEVPITRINSNSNATNNSGMNNNSNKYQNRMQSNNSQSFDQHEMSPNHQAHLQQQKQYQQHQQRLMQQQQLQMKQQYVQPAMNRQSSGLIDNHHHHQQQQQATPRHVQQHPYPSNNQHQIQMQLHQQQQQQLLMRQQHHQQQIIMQQHRQSMDASIPIARQVSKQAIISSTDHPMMKNPNMVRSQPQQQLHKYIPLNDNMDGQPIAQHVVGVPPHMINQMSLGGPGVVPQQNRRMGPNSHPPGAQQPQAAQQHHPTMSGYNPHSAVANNGIMSKQQAAHLANMQTGPHMIQHPDQMHPQQRLQMRPATIAGQPMQQIPHQVSRRVFRAMYDYVANDVDEVSFLENDILVDCVNVDRNWLIGKVARSGQTGMLPANYVELLPSQ